MVYLVVMRVCKKVGGRTGFSFLHWKVARAGRTVVGRAERRRAEFWSHDCAVGKYGILR